MQYVVKLQSWEERDVGSSEVERPLIIQWVVWSIPDGGPIELFPIPTSAPQLM